MDKDLLRIVIIALGVTVVIGIILWSLYKNKKRREKINFIDKGNPLDNIDKSLIIDTDNDDFDIVPIGTAVDSEAADPISIDSGVEDYQTGEASSKINPSDLPDIIQFSIAAPEGNAFNGNVLVDTFQRVGLEYGSMKIFERLDEQRRVDYAVASMVEPGTFPETGLDKFSSPGIVFFIQPSELDDPVGIFDDFIQTINWLAKELGGVMLDHNRQPLSKDIIEAFKIKLAS